jgi:hypothetical protein
MGFPSRTTGEFEVDLLLVQNGGFAEQFGGCGEQGTVTQERTQTVVKRREVFGTAASRAVTGEFIVVHPFAIIGPRLNLANPFAKQVRFVRIKQIGHDPTVDFKEPKFV